MNQSKYNKDIGEMLADVRALNERIDALFAAEVLGGLLNHQRREPPQPVARANGPMPIHQLTL